MNLHAHVPFSMKLAEEYDALFLDNDGTCGLTEELHAEIGTKILQENGVPDMTYEERFSLMGKGEYALWDYLHAQGRAPSISREEFAQMQAQHFTGALERITDPGAILRDGIKELATAFKDAGKPVLVVSNSLRDVVMAVQRAAGIDEMMDGFITFTDLQETNLRKKPHPDAYLLAQDRTFGRGGHYLAVEDSTIGAEAAVAAGCDVIEIIYARLGKTPHAASTYIVSDETSVLNAQRQWMPRQKKLQFNPG